MTGKQIIEQVPGCTHLMSVNGQPRPARPPFTTWVSTITIDGSGSRLCWRRTRRRSTSIASCHSPRSRHLHNVRQIVFHDPNSPGR